MSFSYTLNEEREEGFSLVELLVVIVIIGILSAIAISAFSTQRKKANDATVENDVRNVVLAIENALIDDPNATQIAASSTATNQWVSVLVRSGENSRYVHVPLSEGVVISVTGDNKWYRVYGSHVNGYKYTNKNAFNTRVYYDSARGGFQ